MTIVDTNYNLEIDKSWLQKINNMEKSRAFNGANIKLVFLYIESDGNLNGICTERVFLDLNNVLTADRVYSLIEQHKTWNNRKFVFQSLASFTVNDNQENTLREECYMKDICFNNALPGMQDLSTIFFFMILPSLRGKSKNTRSRRLEGHCRTRRRKRA